MDCRTEHFQEYRTNVGGYQNAEESRVTTCHITDPTGEQWGVNKEGRVEWFNGALGAGFTAYSLLYGVVAGTDQIVALNPNGGSLVVGTAEAWLAQEIEWGVGAEALAASAAALAGVPVAVALAALAATLDPQGRHTAGMNKPEPTREWEGTQPSYWKRFWKHVDEYDIKMNGNTKGNGSGSLDTQGETSPANPDPNDNRPRYEKSEKHGKQQRGNASPAPTNGQSTLGQCKLSQHHRVG